MSKKLYEETDVQNIANSIREKNGLTNTYKVSEMAQAIKDISSGGGASEPYREDTLEDDYIVSSKLYGYTVIPTYFLTTQTQLTSVSSNTDIATVKLQAFKNCSKLSVFDFSKIENIEGQAFSYCNFTSLNFPATLKTIGASFQSNKKLTIVVFNGTPSKIESAAFSSCSSLTSIKVPWAEGTVANAPWGATNATITYNYTRG